MTQILFLSLPGRFWKWIAFVVSVVDTFVMLSLVSSEVLLLKRRGCGIGNCCRVRVCMFILKSGNARIGDEEGNYFVTLEGIVNTQACIHVYSLRTFNAKQGGPTLHTFTTLRLSVK